MHTHAHTLRLQRVKDTAGRVPFGPHLIIDAVVHNFDPLQRRQVQQRIQMLDSRTANQQFKFAQGNETTNMPLSKNEWVTLRTG